MSENKSGGYLVGRKNNKIYVHNKADMGGYLVGRRHSEGGIKGVNKSTNQPIEVETGEIQVTSKAFKNDKKRDFMGKKMTNKEILSYLNQEGGGIAFDEGGRVENEAKNSKNVINEGAGQPIQYRGGEVILTRGAVSSTKKYDFDGQKLTTREIASKINEEAGGVKFEDGGDTKNKKITISMPESQYEEIRLKMGIEKERKDHYDILSKLNAGSITIEDALREIALKEMSIDKKYPFGE